MTDALTSNDASIPQQTDVSLKRRLYVMMFLQYFVQGSYLPVITLYVRSGLNFPPTEMGYFSAAIAVGPLIAPFFIGQIVDRHFPTQHVLSFCHLVGGAIMLVLYALTDYWPILILGAVYSMLYVPSMMLTNSLAFHHLKDRDREFPRVRLWGTLGFILPAWYVEMVLLAGLTGQELNVRRGVVLAVAGVSGIVMGLYSLTLPHTPPAKSDKKELAPGKVVGLLRHRNFLVLVLISFVVAISHKFFFVWNGPFLQRMLRVGGIEAAWEFRIATVGQIAEVAVMAMLGFSIKRYGFKTTMAAGALAYLLRCLIFAFAATLDQQFPVAMGLILLGQALHGFCFGCFLAAAYMYVDRVSPKDVRGSMQTFYGTFVIGVGMVAGGTVGGWIGEWFETRPGAETIREQLGIAGQKGLLSFVRKEDGVNVEYIADWPGIWLSGAAIAAVALVAFLLFFPKSTPEEATDAEPG